MPDTVTPRLYDAMLYAIDLHGRDSRKHSTVPVLVHLFGVCGIVQGDGGSEDEAIAALLHDALEDKPEQTSDEELVRRFGSVVAGMVRAATDTPFGWKGGTKPPWRERKERYLDHVSRVDRELLRPTIADKIDNVQAILADYGLVGEGLWNRFNASKVDQLWYYRSCVEEYEKMGAAPRLVARLKDLVSELTRVVTTPRNG
jgi:(p)ppGpp synthase/HD superfamily hydrolase